jgi:hypothetical protein
MSSTSRGISTLTAILLALIGLLFLASGAAIWFLRPPPKFTARMMLHVAVERTYLLFRPETDWANNEAYLRKQAVLIRDRVTIMAALRDPEIANLQTLKEQADPVQWIENSLTVEFPSPEFIQISSSGERPVEIKKIVAAVIQAYMEKYVYRDKFDREQRRKKIEELRQEYTKKLGTLKERLKQVRERAGGEDEAAMQVVQQLANEELPLDIKRLTEVHQQLLVLRVEFGLHPHWLREVWPRYVAALNCLPGRGLPVNHALVALLHDDAHLLPEAAQGDRPQKDEQYRFLMAMEQALSQRVAKLSGAIKERRTDPDALSGVLEQIEESKKVVQKASDKLLEMEVEKDAPHPISLAFDEVSLSPPDTTKRTIMTWAAAVQAGLGVLLLGLALFQFRARGASFHRVVAGVTSEPVQTSHAVSVMRSSSAAPPKRKPS